MEIVDKLLHTHTSLLKRLGVLENNFGASTGPMWSSVSKKSGKIISINPSTEKNIANVFNASDDDYEKVIETAQKAFLKWRMIPAPQRGEIVRKISEKLREHKSDLGSLVSLEMGKIKQEGDGEVQEMIDIADFAVGQSRMLYGKTMHSERHMHRMYEQWHPLGICGVITAFNFPVAVWAWNAFIAAIAGNVVVWRPSPKTPLCAIAVQKICNEVLSEFNCEGVFSLLISDDLRFAKRFIDDIRIPLISFTGSSDVGAQVGERVAKRFGKSILECSGNNAVIIDRSADTKLALPSVVFGAVGTAGQRCTSTRRVIIHEDIYADFVEGLKDAYSSIRIGDPLDENTLMGPLIDELAVARYQEAIKKLQQEGGEIICEGGILDGLGFFVKPAIALVENHWNIVQQETFAPILYLMKFSDLDEAIAMNNNVPQGLSSAMFTQDLKHAEYYLSCCGSDCGIANINIGTSGAEVGGAFGGEKHTGGGREAGSDAWQAYMRRQTNTINWSDDLPLAQGITFNIKGEKS
ncbi:MAG: aldehyde dehydrogenase family protein [Gammaproteobacteria bacterium]